MILTFGLHMLIAILLLVAMASAEQHNDSWSLITLAAFITNVIACFVTLG